MSVALTAIVLIIVCFMMTIVVAVIAYVGFCGVMWYLENHKPLVDRPIPVVPPRPIVPSISDERVHKPRQVPSPGEGPRELVRVQPTLIETLDSPPQPPRHVPRRVPAQRPDVCEEAPVREEVLDAGFASVLALHFQGDASAHQKNVDAVKAAFALQTTDILYCFLCLEEVLTQGKDVLAIKPYGLNSYASRIWLTTLARFVRAAQGDTAKRESGVLEPLVAEWGYKEEHFISCVKTCEQVFLRTYAEKLRQAFSTQSIRQMEVHRARRHLSNLVAGTAPRGSRLLAPALPPAPVMAALPAIPQRALPSSSGLRLPSTPPGGWCSKSFPAIENNPPPRESQPAEPLSEEKKLGRKRARLSHAASAAATKKGRKS